MRLGIKKVLIIGSIIVIVCGSGFVYYNKKVNDLNKMKLPEKIITDDSNVEKKQAVVVNDNRLVEKSLKTALTGKLIVLENDIDVEHKINYIENVPVTIITPGFLGSVMEGKAVITKVGKATIQYDYITDLSKATLAIKGNNVIITLDKPVLNDRSVKIKEGSFKFDEKHSDISFFGRLKVLCQSIGKKETMDGKAGKQLMQEIPVEAKKKIKENENQKELDNKTKEAFQSIVDNIMNDKNTTYNIIVKIKE